MKLWYGKPTPLVKEGVFNELLERNIESMAREGTTVDTRWLKTGYMAPTYTWTESYNAVQGVKRYYEAWKTGYDGVVIGCAFDPGLTEARSLLDIPVTGVLQSAVLIASCLGHKFSIITIHQAAKAIQIDKIKRYGFADKLASIRSIDISPMEMAKSCAQPAQLISMFSELTAKVATDDDAEAVIPGCTVLSSILTAQRVFQIDGIPIVDPVCAGIKIAEVLVDLNKAYGMGVCRGSIYAAAPGWEQEIPIEF